MDRIWLHRKAVYDEALASPWGKGKNADDAKRLFNRLQFLDEESAVGGAGNLGE